MKLNTKLFLLGGTLLVLSLLCYRLHWLSNTYIHSFMDLAGAILISSVAFLQYIYYSTTKTRGNLILFAVFAGAAILECYHTVASSYLFSYYFQTAHASVTVWSGFAIQLYVSGALAYFVHDIKDRDKPADTNAIIVVTLTLLGAMIFLLFASSPQAYQPQLVFPRPQELIPAMLFIVAFIGYLRQSVDECRPIDRWIIYFMMISICIQALIIPASGERYDAMFDVAHLLKIIAYSCLLVGLGLDIYTRSQPKVVVEQKQTNLSVATLCDDTSTKAMSELQLLTQAARNGDMSKRISLHHFDGEWRTIMEGTNTILDETVRPINALTLVLQSMAEGKLTTKINEEFKGDHNRIKDAINSVTGVAEKFTKELDSLNAAFDAGNYEHRAQVEMFSGDWRKLLEIVNRIVAAVHQTTQAVQAQNWIKSGLAKLAMDLRSNMALDELARVSVNFLARYTESQAAAIYVFDNKQQTLNLIGTFAQQLRDDVPQSFTLGSGLIGQVGLERKSLAINNAPTDFSRIVSATAEMLPRQVIILPLLYEGELKGVLELSRVNPFDPLALEFLNAATDTLASLFGTVEINENTKLLLEQSQKQAEQLQLHQEILKQNNEELEQQTQALRVSEEELRTQQEELQQTNEDLEMRAQCMEVLVSEIKRQNEELEQAQADLFQRAEDLALASKYKGEFLANMSHELRTPLNSMLLLSRSLADNREGNLSTKQVQAAKVMHQSGKDLLSIINDILDLSKIEAGREVMVLGEVNLHEMGSHLALLYEHPAQEKSLYFNVNIDPAIPQLILSDQQRLGQILRNLLTNAFKFTAKGGITLEIAPAPNNLQFLSSSPLYQFNGPILGLSVSDTGIGIPPEKQRHIWEAFQQADGSTSREYGGTGLGLTISRELAKLLGGEIQLRSEPGKGSTFTLYIPLTPVTSETSSSQPAPIASYTPPAVEAPAITAVSTPAAIPASAPAAPAQATSAVQKWLAAAAMNNEESSSIVNIPAPTPAPAPVAVAVPNKINLQISDDRESISSSDSVMLIVEKDPEFAQTLTKLCRENGAKYLLASTAEDAQELISKYTILGIFLDMLLPGRGGWQVLSYLKENSKYMHIPVFVTSSDDDARRALNLGAAGFLQKPFSPAQFGQLFNRVNEINNKKTKNLLLVEDDMGLRLAVYDLLKAEDINIIEASNGATALELISKGDIDLIILDLGLPDMDGFAVLDKAQALQDAKLPPVIIFTGRELSREEYERLQNYSANVIVKGDRSDERLVDEAALFLHRRVADLPDHARKMLASIHDREGMFINKNVLLVDDDIRNIFALVGILEARELNVVTAKNGQEALEQLEANPNIDLILTDIMMPVMDGFEFIRQVRAQSKYSRMPIIALTAKAMKEDRERCLEAGASDYLSKPIDADRLFSMMRVWMYR